MSKEFFKYVIPKKGLIVRFPRTNAALPEVGAEVSWTGREGTYWRRRLKFGDVKIGAKPKEEIKETIIEEQNHEQSFTTTKKGGKS